MLTHGGAVCGVFHGFSVCILLILPLFPPLLFCLIHSLHLSASLPPSFCFTPSIFLLHSLHASPSLISFFHPPSSFLLPPSFSLPLLFLSPSPLPVVFSLCVYPVFCECLCCGSSTPRASLCLLDTQREGPSLVSSPRNRPSPLGLTRDY